MAKRNNLKKPNFLPLSLYSKTDLLVPGVKSMDIINLSRFAARDALTPVWELVSCSFHGVSKKNRDLLENGEKTEGSLVLRLLWCSGSLRLPNKLTPLCHAPTPRGPAHMSRHTSIPPHNLANYPPTPKRPTCVSPAAIDTGGCLLEPAEQQRQRQYKSPIEKLAKIVYCVFRLLFQCETCWVMSTRTYTHKQTHWEYAFCDKPLKTCAD